MINDVNYSPLELLDLCIICSIICSNVTVTYISNQYICSTFMDYIFFLHSEGEHQWMAATIGLSMLPILSHLLVAGCDIGVPFSVRPSVCQHLCRSSTFMSKLVF